MSWYCWLGLALFVWGMLPSGDEPTDGRGPTEPF